MKIHILCFAYEAPLPLRVLCDSVLLQTDPRWVLHVIHDGPPSDAILKVMDLPEYADERVHFVSNPVNTGHWGNLLRRKYLEELEADIDDYVLLTNHDNYYVPRFVEFMLSAGNPDTAIIYCNTVHNHLTYSGQVSELKVGKVDSGAFIVNVPLAKEVGYKHNVGHADGIFARRCRIATIKKGLRITHINKFLFVHN